jgi:hypothetical protein
MENIRSYRETQMLLSTLINVLSRQLVDDGDIDMDKEFDSLLQAHHYDCKCHGAWTVDILCGQQGLEQLCASPVCLSDDDVSDHIILVRYRKCCLLHFQSHLECAVLCLGSCRQCRLTEQLPDDSDPW